MTLASSSGSRREQVRERLQLALFAASEKAGPVGSLDQLGPVKFVLARYLAPFAIAFMIWILAFAFASIGVSRMNLPAARENQIMAAVAIGLAVCIVVVTWLAIRWFVRFRLWQAIALVQDCIDRDAITATEWDETYDQVRLMRPNVHRWMIYGIRKHLRSKCRLY